MNLIPQRLNRGDAVGIVSPSSPVTEVLASQLRSAIELLSGLGLKVMVGEHTYASTWGYAAAPWEKAEDINRMFADDSIHAILSSQGGATANACLPYLDWDVIRAHPKIFTGMSDISVLLNAITSRTGLITFHGADVVWGLGRNPVEYVRNELVANLMEGRIGAIPPNSPRRMIRAGVAEGRLLGGNLNCLLKLAGTPYFPDFRGEILFVEAVNVDPERCDCLFQQLKQMGVFGQIRGVLVGFINGLQNDAGALMQMEDVLLRVTEEFDFPILKCNDFGHNCANTILPVGARVRLDADALTVEVLEQYVI
ncbi:MAG: LD-carboxypeptidase [Chloroflexi bacterium HGW-Chloroflexi-8]|jgi:muramoyltetrapeptide carboxypeptidase|nr:MAG: LD-carboxypeptidase [Chloroflexi bacterium HGW-Chloroflexi-8]